MPNLKAFYWQYEQGLKTFEDIEFEYGLYTSRELTYTPLIESNSNSYMMKSTSDEGIRGCVKWQPEVNVEVKHYLPLKHMRIELWYVYFGTNKCIYNLWFKFIFVEYFKSCKFNVQFSHY